LRKMTLCNLNELNEQLFLVARDGTRLSAGQLEGSRYVESSHVRKLLLECPVAQLPALLDAVAMALGNVSENRWQSLCAAIGRLETNEPVYQSGTTVFLRANRKS
jgi:hypothetical protein